MVSVSDLGPEDQGRFPSGHLLQFFLFLFRHVMQNYMYFIQVIWNYIDDQNYTPLRFLLIILEICGGGVQLLGSHPFGILGRTTDRLAFNLNELFKNIGGTDKSPLGQKPTRTIAHWTIAHWTKAHCLIWHGGQKPTSLKKKGLSLLLNC